MKVKIEVDKKAGKGSSALVKVKNVGNHTLEAGDFVELDLAPGGVVTILEIPAEIKGSKSKGKAEE